VRIYPHNENEFAPTSDEFIPKSRKLSSGIPSMALDARIPASMTAFWVMLKYLANQVIVRSSVNSPLSAID
jgi:hypothetical protein